MSNMSNKQRLIPLTEMVILSMMEDTDFNENTFTNSPFYANFISLLRTEIVTALQEQGVPEYFIKKDEVDQIIENCLLEQMQQVKPAVQNATAYDISSDTSVNCYSHDKDSAEVEKRISLLLDMLPACELFNLDKPRSIISIDFIRKELEEVIQRKEEHFRGEEQGEEANCVPKQWVEEKPEEKRRYRVSGDKGVGKSNEQVLARNLFKEKHENDTEITEFGKDKNLNEFDLETERKEKRSKPKEVKARFIVRTLEDLDNKLKQIKAERSTEPVWTIAEAMRMRFQKTSDNETNEETSSTMQLNATEMEEKNTGSDIREEWRFNQKRPIDADESHETTSLESNHEKTALKDKRSKERRREEPISKEKQLQEKMIIDKIIREEKSQQERRLKLKKRLQSKIREAIIKEIMIGNMLLEEMRPGGIPIPTKCCENKRIDVTKPNTNICITPRSAKDSYAYERIFSEETDFQKVLKKSMATTTLHGCPSRKLMPSKIPFSGSYYFPEKTPQFVCED